MAWEWNQKLQSVLHPVRFRLFVALRELGAASTKEIAARCSDIPPATLYRHIAALHKEGVLEVVQENRVNGIIERVYRLAEDWMGEVEQATPDQWMALLYQFLLTAVVDFERYLSGGKGEPAKEAGFRYTLLNLSEEEFVSFTRELNECIQKYQTGAASPDRKTWRFSTITVPVDMNE